MIQVCRVLKLFYCCSRFDGLNFCFATISSSEFPRQEQAFNSPPLLFFGLPMTWLGKTDVVSLRSS